MRNWRDQLTHREQVQSGLSICSGSSLPADKLRLSALSSSIVFAFLLLLVTPSLSIELYDEAPTFALRTLDHDYFYLSNLCGPTLRDPNSIRKIVVLDFWATWCKPCHHKLDLVRSMIARTDTAAIALVIIAEDSLATGPRILEWLSPFTPHEFCLLDPYHLVMKDMYNIETLPTTIVIEPMGRVVGFFGPECSADSLAIGLGGVLARLLQ